MPPRRALLASACAVLIACGTNVDLGGSGAGTDGGASHPDGAPADCPGYAAPNTSAKCKASDEKPLQPNGCYGGYYCRVVDRDCQCPSVACGGSEAGLCD
jgi:hypothetical protein